MKAENPAKTPPKIKVGEDANETRSNVFESIIGDGQKWRMEWFSFN